MVQIFGAELRRDLVALPQKTNVFNMMREERQIAARKQMARQAKHRPDFYDLESSHAWFW